MARYSMFGMAGVGITAAIGFVFALSSLGNTLIPPEVSSPEIFNNDDGGAGPTVFATATQALKKFSSVDELKSYLLSVEANRGELETAARSFFGGSSISRGDVVNPTVTDQGTGLESLQSSAPPAPSSADAPRLAVIESGDKDYSTTNVQVQGVDEPDFLKNDGKYVYILSGDRLTIVDAYPPENATIAVKIALDIQQGQYLQNMFLNNDTLVIFYQEYSRDFVIQQYDFAPQPISRPNTHALLLDVSDRENPQVLHNYKVSGNYNNARMIGDQVYLITTSDLYDYRNPILPLVSESSSTIVRPDIYYFDNPDLYYTFNTVTSIDITADEGENAVNSTTFLMNPASTLYASEDNIYIAYQKNHPYYYYQSHSKDRFFEALVPLLPQNVQQEIREIEGNSDLTPSEKWDRVSELLQDTYNHMPESEKRRLFEEIRQALADYDERIAKETQITVIHKIAIGPEGISYSSRGEVPGRLLNQFSMDEHGDRFRVATTSEFYSPYRGSTMYNNVYVLDEAMKIVGKLEEIARGESIYSSRFMDDRLYLVTFQRIDPFFVIDLSSDAPKVLGELKLPGYSNYLHPYDENHVISIGKETKENQYGGIETLGIKLVLFNVSDVNNPAVVDVYEIGSSGTDSEVLYDHKALLFDRSKNVLSIPVSIYPDYAGPRYTEDGRYIEPKVWRGFYVFGVNPEAGFMLKGIVEHLNDTGDYYYIYGTQGSRSFYIADVLYTVSLNNLIKMNDLQSLNKINQLEIGPSGSIIKSPQLEDDTK
ncbi:beta-propeller domain-containing protein [Candidatus Nitrososphaera gargensis]|nr:beta-propeller domain-containing protein [Candidatus Nitrososphaera gargensis]